MKSPEEIRADVIMFLMNIIEMPADKVLDKQPDTLQKKYKTLVTWVENRDKFRAIPIDKLKAAELLLKYLSAEGKTNENAESETIIFYGEGEIEQ